MKAEDLDLRELITFGDGSIDPYGRRLVLHSLHALGQFRQDLMGTLGHEDARRACTAQPCFWRNPYIYQILARFLSERSSAPIESIPERMDGLRLRRRRKRSGR